MAWVLVALFIFNKEPMIMSDNILYESIEKCNYSVHESSTEIPLSNSTILQLCKDDEITVYILSGQMANYKNEFCGYLIEPL